MSELVISGLRAGVGGSEILRGIDLTVRSGEVHAIMGPNGSGKSTLSHVLMGKPGYEVLAGSVTLDGVDLLALPTWERAGAGLFLAMQYPVEVPGVRVIDVVREAFTAAGRPEAERTPEAVDALVAAEAAAIGFDDKFLVRALNVDLSGGERKRSETVQLGALDPHIAILDELDSGLDVDALRIVSARVEELTHRQQLGVLAITHYSRLLHELRPDRIHVLIRGRIVASGGPELSAELETTGYAAYGNDDDDPAPGAPAAAAVDPFADPLA